MSASRPQDGGGGPRGGRSGGYGLAASLLLLASAFVSCTAHRSPGDIRQVRTAAPVEHLLSGQWFRLDDGRLRASVGPLDARVGFAPWTVQSRIAGFLQLDGRVYLAINGWGVIALDRNGASAFRATSFENRTLFAGRTINGLYAEHGEVLLHLYRNTLFDTAAPSPPAVSLARLNPKDGRLTGEALPLTRDGWEAADVVQLPDGHWAIAWKKTEARRIEFAYELYTPLSGRAVRITSAAFLKSYGFQAIGRAPASLQSINAVAEHAVAPGTVIDYVVRRPALSWDERFREGSRRELISGNSALLTVPVFHGAAYWALAGRRVITASHGESPRILRLPELPVGYAYTDLWCDGRTLMVSWERQHFAEVAAAGLFVATLP